MRLGLATGGYMPKGWLTLDGPRPDLGEIYGLTECWSPDYPPRTAKNVFAADATVRIAVAFNSPGEICTFRAIEKYGKPYFDINLSRASTLISAGFLLKPPSKYSLEYDHDLFITQPCNHINDAAFAHRDRVTEKLTVTNSLLEFIIHHEIKILNVAGNSEQTTPGIGRLAEDFLVTALSIA